MGSLHRLRRHSICRYKVHFRCLLLCAGWVFPKYDHVAVGTGTVVNKTAIKQYQQARGRIATLVSVSILGLFLFPLPLKALVL